MRTLRVTMMINMMMVVVKMIMKNCRDFQGYFFNEFSMKGFSLLRDFQGYFFNGFLMKGFSLLRDFQVYFFNEFSMKGFSLPRDFQDYFFNEFSLLRDFQGYADKEATKKKVMKDVWRKGDMCFR